MKECDTQDIKPEIGVCLDRVGVTNLKTIVKTSFRGHAYRFIPKIELTVDLDEGKKGAHLSRLIESITETIEEEAAVTHESLEKLCRLILERLDRKHPFRRARIILASELVVEKKTPVSGKRTYEAHDIEVEVSAEAGKYSKRLTVSVLGNTVCPHAMSQNNGKPHIQRAIGTLKVKSDYPKEVMLEDLIECVEKSFSSPVYTLLKTPDESRVVEIMFANPKFAEDVCREILCNAEKKFKGAVIHARVLSQESIHRHDVVAEGKIES